MDRKAIIVVTSSIAFIVLWTFVITPRYFTKQAPPRPTNVVAAAASPSSPAIGATSAPSGTVTSSAPAVVTPEAPEQTLVVTNDLARFTFTSHGGGVKQIELLRFPEIPVKGQTANTNRLATLNYRAPVAALTLSAGTAIPGGGTFDLRPTDAGLRAEQVLPNGLAVIKEFRPSSNYLFETTIRIENRSGAAIKLDAQQLTVGTATPMNAHDRGDAVGLMWFDGQSAKDVLHIWFDNRTLGCFPGTPHEEYRGGQSNVVWASAHNQFFAMVAMPATNAAEIVAKKIKLPPPDKGELAPGAAPPPEPVGVQTAIAFPPVSLPAAGAVEHKLTFYAGPKEYRTLAVIGDQRANGLDKVMGFGFFGFFAKLLLLSMNGLHDLLSIGYGWAIVVITIIIKLLFWPLTASSTRSMKRMAALQPQMKALQDRYKDDAQKLNKKMMEFWKEHKVNPLGGCLPMLLQIPVFFGFFTMIRSAIELRGASFLWVADLSQPDTLFYLAGFPVNLLPLLMGATMLWQARLTPPSPGMDPMQQKIMKYLPLMFMVFLYGYSAALTLYWTTQNLLTILQTKLTKTDPAPAPAASTPAAPTRPMKKK